MADHTSVKVSGSKYCDFCSQLGKTTIAHYDGKTSYGPWANMCEYHFNLNGVGLGLGKGQKLIYVVTPGE